MALIDSTPPGPPHHFIFKTTLILITQAAATLLIRKRGKRQRGEVRVRRGKGSGEERKGKRQHLGKGVRRKERQKKDEKQQTIKGLEGRNCVCSLCFAVLMPQFEWYK